MAGTRSETELSRRDRRLLWALVAGLCLVAVGVRLGVALASGFQVDDAWITYRYAENLAAGEGFVYNPGERVYGTTTPLLTLLLAGAELAGVPLPAASLGLSLAATVATLLCLASLAAPRAGVAWAVLVAGLVAVAPSHLVWSVSGMETALSIAFLAAAFLAYARGRWTLLGLAAAGAFLTRFDAVVLLVALPVAEGFLGLARRALPIAAGSPPGGDSDATGRPAWRGLLRAAGLFLLAAGPWIVFATVYFGSPVPHAVRAKTGLHRVGEAGLSLERVPGLLRAAVDPGLAPPPLEVFLAVLGVAALLARRDRLLAVPVWLAGYGAFLVLGQVHVHPWYVAPFHPPLLLIWGLGLAWAGRALSRRGLPRLSRPARLAAALGAAAVVGVISVPAALAEARDRQAVYEGAHAALGRWLAERARPGEVICAWDVGYVGHLTGRRILDFQGIVSPEVVPFRRRGDPAGVLRDLRPEWAVVGLYGRVATEVLGAPEVRELYEEVHRNTRTGAEDVLRSGHPRAYGAEYVVLRRRGLRPE